MIYLFSIPHSRDSSIPHLLLQQEDPIQQSLWRRWTPGHINIHRYNPIHPSQHTITIMIIPAPISTAPHTNHPFRIRHLIIKQSQRRRHFVGHRPGDQHHVCLSGRCAKNDAESVLVVSGHRGGHHFYAAACKAEGEGPEGTLADPVDELVDGCPGGRVR